MRNEPAPEDKLIREVEQFLYREARLLDERRFHEWLQLFADDVRYFLEILGARYRCRTWLLPPARAAHSPGPARARRSDCRS